MLRGSRPASDGTSTSGMASTSASASARGSEARGGKSKRGGSQVSDAPPGFVSGRGPGGRRGGAAETLRLEEVEGPEGEVVRQAVYEEYVEDDMEDFDGDMGGLVKDDDDEADWEGDDDDVMGRSGSATPGTPAVSGTDLFNDDSEEAIGKLRHMFYSVDPSGQGVLREELFIKAMAQEQNMQSITAAERNKVLKMVFAKIDSDLSGCVSWSEFLSYMLYERKSRIVPMAKIVRLLQTEGETSAQKRQKHADMVTCLTCGSGKVYDFLVSAGHDKKVMIWRLVEDEFGENQLDLVHTIKVNEVIVDVSVSSDQALLICASTNDSIYAYELNQFKVKNYTLVMNLGVRGFTPTCLGQEHKFGMRAVVSAKDKVYSYLMSTQRGELARLTFRFDKEYDTLRLQMIDPSELAELMPMMGSMGAPLSVHDGWINRFVVCKDLGCVFSVGRDGYLASTHLGSFTVTKRVFAHHKGANDLCYSEHNMAVFTCGQDHCINVYHPLTLEFLQKLGDHKSPVVSLCLKEKDNHLISKNPDKEIRLWELRSRALIEQIGVTKNYYPENRITYMEYFPKFPPGKGGEGLFVTCTRKPEIWKQIEMVDPRNVVVHENPLLGVFYMPFFGSLLTLDETGIAMVWNFETGQVTSKYLCSHGLDAATGMLSTLSCATLGNAQRRLFTGSEDGSIRVWNSNSGSALALLTSPTPGYPVTGILQVDMKSGMHVLSAGWSRSAALHVDPKGPKSRLMVLEPVDIIPKIHETDIECIVRLPGSDLVATGSADGKIKVWNVYSHQVHKVLQPSLAIREGWESPGLGSPGSAASGSGLAAVTNVNIECMCAARSTVAVMTTLLSGGMQPQICVWNTRLGILASTFSHALMSGTTVQIGLDRYNSLLVCAGSKGTVAVLDVTNLGLARNLDEGMLPRDCTSLVGQVSAWKAHDSSVATAEFVQHGAWERCGPGGSHKRMPVFVVTSGTLDCHVYLWTIHGEMIGDYNSGNLYSLESKGIVEYDDHGRYVGETREIGANWDSGKKEELMSAAFKDEEESDDDDAEEDLFFDARVFRSHLDRFKSLSVSERFSLAQEEARAAIVGRNHPYVQKLNPNLCGRFGERLRKGKPALCKAELGFNSGLGVKRPIAVTGGMIVSKMAPIKAPALKFTKDKAAAMEGMVRLQL